MAKALIKRKAKARTKKSRQARTLPAAECKGPEPVDLSEIRLKIIQAVNTEALKMVQSTINDVKQGHYLGMKYLFELTGLFPIPPETDLPQEDSLAATLLRHLGLADNSIPASAVTKDSFRSGDENGGGTVE